MSQIHAILQHGGEKPGQTARNSLARKLASFYGSKTAIYIN
jgi:hypothetical protein